MKPLLYILLTALGVQAASGQTIKAGMLAPEGSPYHKTMLAIAESWRTLSEGKVTLRIYPGGILGDESDMIRKMRIGQLHAAALTSMSLTSITPDVEAFSFPSLVQTDDELDAVIERVGPVIEKQLAEKGFTLVAWTSAGWVHFFAREPVVTPADLQRQKIFFWGSDTVYFEMLKRSRFQPISLPVGELLPSLQSGLVDAFASPPAVALAFQWYPRALNLTAMRWQPLPGCIVVDSRTWSKVPEPYRAAMIASARKIAGELRQQSHTLEEEAIAAMKKNGLVVHEVPAEVRKEWIDIVQREGYPIFIGPRFSREIFNQVQDVVLPMRHP
jgi:TRAP-type C4-dicarboxylate transport system substrate-binding protein